ncbi:hypothetical protein ONZ45_g12198 [Pleurotus djamor]|nr:hypothetical protein ONZ45_g12198 [Pleurotus djamor]
MYITLGGTAGNVVANRLSELPDVQVLVVEAGGSHDNDLNIQVPAFSPNLFQSSYDWDYTTTPQKGLNGREVNYVRGRILGGSSSINGMLYTRGSAEDYNRIAQMTGDDGWSWNRLQHYMRRHERFSRSPDGHDLTGQYDPSVHGFHGVTSVTLSTPIYPAHDLILQVARDSAEFPFNLDVNSGKPLGVGWHPSTVSSDGRRASSATSYLAPHFLARSNLHVLTNHHVTRLLPNRPTHATFLTFDTVEFVPEGDRNSTRLITATREIILSGGVIGTPNILLHSGIGDSAHLLRVGIKPLHHLPDVGRNFTDHVVIPQQFSVNSHETLDEVAHNQTLFDQALGQWQSNGTGPLSTASSLVSFTRIPSNASVFDLFEDPAAGPETPHIELQFWPGLIGLPGNNLIIVSFVLTPLSRGLMTISSADPFANPLIDPVILQHEFDRAAAREALRASKRFLSHPVWKDYIKGPVGQLRTIDLTVDEDVDAFIKNQAVLGLHSVGTAAMSPKGASWGVTDPDLRLKGVKGVRIVDASVLVES